jgi:ABC-type branched-subunit amino acid transport system ATPase component
VQPPTLFGLDISPAGQPHRYAIVCVVGLALGVLAVLNLRRGEAGRRYLAVRANERGAASVGLSVPGAKLGAFATSAGLAGLAGSLATFQFSIADFTSYGVFQSITALAFTVVGGIGYVAGAIFAAVSAAGGLATNLIVNELEIGTIDLWLPILSGVFVIDVMVRFPDGIIMQFVGMKDAIAKRLPTRRRPEPVVRAAPGDRPTPTLPRVSDVPAGETVLAARDVRVTYGNVVAVNDVSFELAAGQVVGVIGPNGAGKTSLIDALTGFAPMAKGTIEFRGRRLGGRGAVARARLGMARTFQNLELFDDLSVRENILTALDSRSRLAYARDLVHPGRGELNDAARAAVAMLDLDRDLDTVAADLPQGRRRMVAIARLVAQQPSVVMLDEPAAGLNGGERRTACEVFRALADQLGVAVLLVEHNVDVVSTTCDHLIVLDFGRVIASGPTAEVLRDPAVRAAYLGRLTPEREAAAEAAVTTDV